MRALMTGTCGLHLRLSCSACPEAGHEGPAHASASAANAVGLAKVPARHWQGWWVNAGLVNPNACAWSYSLVHRRAIHVGRVACHTADSLQCSSAQGGAASEQPSAGAEKAEGVGDQACWPCMLAMHVHDLHVSRTKYSGLPPAC